jgi:hypothetical protein
VLLVAETDVGSGIGSGKLQKISIWSYDEPSDHFNLSNSLNLSRQAEFKVIDDGPLGGYLVTADALFQQGESYFAPHVFTINIYKYSFGNSAYTKVLEYLTSKKYPSEVPIDVISHELPIARKLLDRVYDSNGLENLKK